VWCIYFYHKFINGVSRIEEKKKTLMTEERQKLVIEVPHSTADY
jgi:hypothetical protein